MVIVEGVGSNAFVGLADFSVSGNNVLVYGGGSNLVSELTWRGRDGAKLGSIEASASYLAPRLSPDGGKLAFSRADLGNGNADVWIFDSVRNTSSRLTFNPALDFHAVWSADGKGVMFSSNRGGAFSIFQKDATGVGPEKQITKTESNQFVDDWSPDGRFVIFVQQGAHTTENLWVLPLERPHEPFPADRNGRVRAQRSVLSRRAVGRL